MTAYAGELRYQDMVAVTAGWPPALLAKDAGLPFVAGAPQLVSGRGACAAQGRAGLHLPALRSWPVPAADPAKRLAMRCRRRRGAL